MNTVTILLATYNGEKHINEMVDSVIAQDFEDWTLILSDDGSTDGTAAILENYAEKYPEKIVHYKSGRRFGNAQGHFLHLLETFHEAPYIMFCDQDDVWHKDKVGKTLKKMKETEEEGLPAMVHTDLCVVGKDLEVLDPSFMRFSKLNGNRVAFNQLLVQNMVTGCTMMLNGALAKLAVGKSPADKVLMHDWWLALIASAFGKIAFLDEPTIDYRQHGDNSVGAKNVRSASFLLGRLKNGQSKKSVQNSIVQAKAFLDCFEDTLPEELLPLLKDFASLENKNFLARDAVYLKHRINKFGLTRIVAQYLGL